MTQIERDGQQMVIRSGSAVVTLDKGARRAVLNRSLLFWTRRPKQRSLEDMSDVVVRASVDRASGVAVYHILLVMRDGERWLVPAGDKQDATRTATALRAFLGLADGAEQGH
jgi:hypothetical protein